MKKTLLSMLLFFVVSSVAIAAYKHEMIASRFIQHSNFIEIKEGIFVSPDTTKTQRDELIELVDNAKTRITEVFGTYSAAPIIISSLDPKNRLTYSNNSYGKAYLPPFSKNKAYIVLGENGHNIDVIAHELMHAEVFHRIGYVNQIVKIPVWFNEGIAMQVDYRSRYNNPTVAKQLKDLKYGWQFFKGNDDELTQHYSLAKEEVKVWLKNRKDSSFYKFLDDINSGQEFHELYKKF